MKALLVLAHYFKPEAQGGTYSSTRQGMAEHRRRSLGRALLAWTGHVLETAMLDIASKTTRLAPGALEQLDITVVVNGDDHLLTPPMQKAFGLQVAQIRLANPRMLPFAAQRVMADNAGRYDWFLYSEDDLVLHDPFAFAKLQDFQQRFGPARVLQPHRFELNLQGRRRKTYIDGDLRPGFIEPFLALVPETQAPLSLEFCGLPVALERSRNPHAGFFALTAGQLTHWMRQKHFLDGDCSFVSPLESAATLGLVKTFSIFKARAPHQAWFEIEHCDDKFSRLRLPYTHPNPTP